MKKLMATLLAALLVLSLAGAAMARTPEAPAPQSAPQSDLLDSMTPAIHGLILSMLHQGRNDFDPQDRELTWEALYNTLSLYGQLDERAEYVGEDLAVPLETVQDFSAALVASPDQLGELPADLADRMVYDPEIDCYQVVCGNDSLAQIHLDSVHGKGQNLELTGTLVYLVDDSALVSFRATLVCRDNLFGYAITGLELL